MESCARRSRYSTNISGTAGGVAVLRTWQGLGPVGTLNHLDEESAFRPCDQNLGVPRARDGRHSPSGNPGGVMMLFGIDVSRLARRANEKDNRLS
jgi:hypothetical protein